jgi:hypothetical protein
MGWVSVSKGRNGFTKCKIHVEDDVYSYLVFACILPVDGGSIFWAVSLVLVIVIVISVELKLTRECGGVNRTVQYKMTDSASRILLPFFSAARLYGVN